MRPNISETVGLALCAEAELRNLRRKLGAFRACGQAHASGAKSILRTEGHHALGSTQRCAAGASESARPNISEAVGLSLSAEAELNLWRKLVMTSLQDFVYQRPVKGVLCLGRSCCLRGPVEGPGPTPVFLPLGPPPIIVEGNIPPPPSWHA